MKHARLALTLVFILAAAGPAVAADGKGSHARAHLNSYNENPTLSTTGHGSFDARIEDGEIRFELSYDDLEGTPVMAHIHLGMPWVNGGILAFLCNSIDGSPLDNDCPANGGSIEGTILAADVLAIPAQEFAAGAFDELVKAIRAGATYVNVHTSLVASGEIRGQIGVDNRRRK
jgi:hypothetical protein